MKFCNAVLTSMLVGAVSISSVQADFYKKFNKKDEVVVLNKITSFVNGGFDEGAAEIVSFDSRTDSLYVTNGEDDTVDVIDISNPYNPTVVEQLPIDTFNGDDAGGPNSVDTCRGLAAVAVENDDDASNGFVVFYDTRSLTPLASIEVGVLPDMVTFTPNCRYVLTANEGEPLLDDDDEFTGIDPEGSVSIIDLRRGVYRASVRNVDFTLFNGYENLLNDAGIRVFGPGPNQPLVASQDFEPEFITVSRNSRFAFVTLQENNAMVVIDIRRARIIDINSFGTQDHGQVAFDPNDRDGLNIDTTSLPVSSFLQPDTISSYRFRGRTFIVTANEGDSRDFEQADVEDLDNLDPVIFADQDELDRLGRLEVTTVNGDDSNDGDLDELFAFGSRSFSIFSTSGRRVFDSGSDFEDITAAQLGIAGFNADNDEFILEDESRSNDAGPEPEGLALGRIKGRTYAFIGLERVGGIMIYDITNPYRVKFQSYFNDRPFNAENQFGDDDFPDLPDPSIDLAPEGLEFIPAWKSPTRKPLLAVAHEVSSSITLYEIDFD